MNTYCVTCRKKTGNEDPKVVKNSKGRLMMLSKCPICKKGKSRFVKQQEAAGLLSSLGIKTPLSKVPLLNVLF